MDIKMEKDQVPLASIDEVPNEDEEFENALNFTYNLNHLIEEKKEKSKDDEQTLAKKKFISLTQQMKDMTVDEQIELQPKLYEALSECQKFEKPEDCNKYHNNRIYASEILAKIGGSRAIVRITPLDRKGKHPNQEGYCHRVVDAASLDPEKLRKAVLYNKFRPSEMSADDARKITGVAFAGDAESLEPTFSVRHALKARKPKISSLREDQQRDQHPTMYIIGKTIKGDLWIMCRTKWNKCNAYSTSERKLKECLNKAENDFKNYVKQLQEGEAFIRNDTPRRSFTPNEYDNMRREISYTPDSVDKKSTESDEHTDSDNDDSDDSKSEKSTESDKPKKSTKLDEPEKSTESDKPKKSTESDEPEKSTKLDEPKKSTKSDEQTDSDDDDSDSDVQMAM